MTTAIVGKAIKSNPQISYFHSPKPCLHFTQLEASKSTAVSLSCLLTSCSVGPQHLSRAEGLGPPCFMSGSCSSLLSALGPLTPDFLSRELLGV